MLAAGNDPSAAAVAAHTSTDYAESEDARRATGGAKKAGSADADAALVAAHHQGEEGSFNRLVARAQELVPGIRSQDAIDVVAQQAHGGGVTPEFVEQLRRENRINPPGFTPGADRRRTGPDPNEAASAAMKAGSAPDELRQAARAPSAPGGMVPEDHPLHAAVAELEPLVARGPKREGHFAGAADPAVAGLATAKRFLGGSNPSGASADEWAGAIKDHVDRLKKKSREELPRHKHGDAFHSALEEHSDGLRRADHAPGSHVHEASTERMVRLADMAVKDFDPRSHHASRPIPPPHAVADSQGNPVPSYHPQDRNHAEAHAAALNNAHGDTHTFRVDTLKSGRLTVKGKSAPKA